MDARVAMKVIGSQNEYLLYKAANSLISEKANTSNDPMHMMLGLMLGKGLLGHDYHDKEKRTELEALTKCAKCGQTLDSKAAFCSQCGNKVKP